MADLGVDYVNVVYPLVGYTPWLASASYENATFNKILKYYLTTKAIRKLEFFKLLKLFIVIYL